MPSRRYLDFDLLLEQHADGEYQAVVTGTPLGETTSVPFRLPFDAQTLEILLLKLDPGRSGTRRVGASSQQQAAMDFGAPLFETIFPDELAMAWTRSQDLARHQDAGLRLRLRLSGAQSTNGLSSRRPGSCRSSASSSRQPRSRGWGTRGARRQNLGQPPENGETL